MKTKWVLFFGNDSSAKPVIDATDIIKRKGTHNLQVQALFPIPELYCYHESCYYFLG
ncbi:MAG: hypothetical protein IPP53_10215 [Bacteroidetes bacterium]|nr:hypothetical protein [Bacteroidota bacterium]